MSLKPAYIDHAALAGAVPNAPPTQSHSLYVPSMHCAGCMSKIERHISAIPGVISARANLSRKEVQVLAEASLDGFILPGAMSDIGFAAELIDGSQRAPDDADDAKRLLKRLAVAGFGMMNVMLLSVSVWSGAEDATRQLLHLISALIAVPVLIYAAQPFFQNAFYALRVARLNMDVPISLAILMAAMISFYEAMTGGAHAYFDAALALTFFLLGGRYLDLLARKKARSAAAHLARLQTVTAHQILDDQVVDVAASSLRPGAIIEVRAGEHMPADGLVRRGQGDSDRSFLTGESAPVAIFVGSQVFAGEMNLNAVLEIEVTSAAADSVLRRFIDLVDLAERGRDTYRSLADRAAAFYAPLVHLLAALAFALWWGISGDIYLALTIAIAVLIITCPCALGLAVPAVMTTASGRLFAAGILLKSPTALERIAKIDTVIFDKTGTLTTGNFKIHSLDKWPKTDRALLRGLAKASNHPLARAISTALAKDALPSVPLDAVTEHPGRGISASYNGVSIRLGSAAWLQPDQPDNAKKRQLGFQIGDAAVHWLAFDEQLKPGLADMLSYIDQLGLRRILLTGDHEGAARTVANQLGFAAYHAAMTPTAKLDFVRRLQADGASVLMVGDGLNDTGSMAVADASIAPAQALDAARSAADVVLLGTNLQKLALLLATAKTARRRILQNFAAAGLYNLLAIPLAVSGIVTPLIAAIAMSASSITVILNAIRPYAQTRGERALK